MSVDFPAPFSPSSAWISPRRSSKSIASFATSEPNRLVIPRSSRARASPDIGRSFSVLLDFARDVRDVAALDLVRRLGDLGLVLGPGGGDLADAGAVVGQVERGVRPALERAVLGRLDRVEHGDVDLLDGRGQHLRADVGLVGVDADALHRLLLRRVEDAEAALARDLEDDLRTLRDLVERQLLALRLVDEVLRVAVEGLDARVGRLGAGLVARDVVIHRRDLLAADGADDLLAARVLGVQAREVAGQVARLLLGEEQALDV